MVQVQDSIIDKYHDPLAANAHASPVAQLSPISDASSSAIFIKVDQNGKAGNLADAPGEEECGEISQRTPGADALTPEDADIRKDYDDTIFPQQLMDMVERETNGGATVNGERVLEWLPAGDSFVIRDKKSLELEVLPKYFRTKCKSMSFVRKLYRQVIGISFTDCAGSSSSGSFTTHVSSSLRFEYRWGFRRVEKYKSGTMVFTHVNFVRDEKKRCLIMRSVAKKTPTIKDFPFGLVGRPPAAINVPQGFGLNYPQYGMDPMSSVLSMTNGGGLGESSSLAMANRFPQMGSMGITYLLRLQKIELERQRQLMIVSMMANGLDSTAASAFSLPTAVGLNTNYGMSNFGMSFLLASELLKRDPNMR